MFSALSSSRLWRAASTSISSRSGAIFSRRLPRAGRGAVTLVAGFALGSAFALGAALLALAASFGVGLAVVALAAARFGAGAAASVFGAALLALVAGFGAGLAAAALAVARFGAGAAASVFGAALLALAAAGFGAGLAAAVFGAAFDLGAAAAFGLALALALVAALGFGSAATRRFGLSSAGVGLRAMAASCLFIQVSRVQRCRPYCGGGCGVFPGGNETPIGVFRSPLRAGKQRTGPATLVAQHRSRRAIQRLSGPARARQHRQGGRSGDAAP